MKKKILLVVGIVILAFVGFFVYISTTTRSHSPFEEVAYKYEDLDLKVSYCRPYKKGRLIFGSESQGALLPHGEYWRLGANDATEITFSRDVKFAGEDVTAGTYRMYAVPNDGAWEVSLNSEIGEFGYFKPNYDMDVAKVTLPVSGAKNEIEQFTIDFDNDSTTVYMGLKWDKTMIQVPIL